MPTVRAREAKLDSAADKASQCVGESAAIRLQHARCTAIAKVATLALLTATPASHAASKAPRAPHAPAFRVDAPGIRGMTIGPIESACHPGKGYGTRAYEDTLDELTSWGAGWVSLTPFGRVGSLQGLGVDPTFEVPHERNRADLGASIDAAHARGLRVLVVPHLWVESGDWRAKIDPDTDAGWAAWSASYARYVLSWAEVAERHHAEMFAVGVELRSWVTTTRAPSFRSVIAKVRQMYHGLLTYSGNWDDAADTLIWNDVDLLGVNGFYPLADGPDATLESMTGRAQAIAKELVALGSRFRKPVYFAEMGYTTRPNPAWNPWEWPEDLGSPSVDEGAQARATTALLVPLVDAPGFAGFFVWRVYADPHDVSQEPAFGFSPRGKRAEAVLRSLWKRPWAGERHARWPALAVDAEAALHVDHGRGAAVREPGRQSAGATPSERSDSHERNTGSPRGPR